MSRPEVVAVLASHTVIGPTLADVERNDGQPVDPADLDTIKSATWNELMAAQRLLTVTAHVHTAAAAAADALLAAVESAIGDTDLTVTDAADLLILLGNEDAAELVVGLLALVGVCSAVAESVERLRDRGVVL